MRRWMIMMMLVSCQMVALAQKGLHIESLFAGKVVPQERMVETRVRGRSLSKYGLTYFHSLRFSMKDKEQKEIRRLLKQDLEGRPEQDYETSSDYENYKVFLQLPPQGSTKRMLCYKEYYEQVLVIYMEGPEASFKTLEKLSNK